MNNRIGELSRLNLDGAQADQRGDVVVVEFEATQKLRHGSLAVALIGERCRKTRVGLGIFGAAFELGAEIGLGVLQLATAELDGGEIEAGETCGRMGGDGAAKALLRALPLPLAIQSHTQRGQCSLVARQKPEEMFEIRNGLDILTLTRERRGEVVKADGVTGGLAHAKI